MTPSTSAKKSQLGDFTRLRYKRRKFHNALMCSTLGIAALLALTSLGLVFGYVILQGMPALTWDFFWQNPKPVGETGGGMLNALLGTTIMVSLGSAIGVPWGVFVGVYLSEYGRGKLAAAVRFATEMLASVPSIIVGLFVYVIVVRPMHRFSAVAGSIALGIIMVPVIARSTEELLKLVPVHIREAGLALGIPRWKVILRVVLRGSLGGIVTGVMLAVARVAGETAPLLFTALNNRFLQWNLDQPMASLPVQIYSYAIAPFEDWNRQAWAGAVVLVLFVFLLNLVTRLILRPASTGARE